MSMVTYWHHGESHGTRDTPPPARSPPSPALGQEEQLQSQEGWEHG